jgi:hypothetical protein
VLAADGCDRGINEPLCIDCKGVKFFGSSRLGEKMEGLQEIDVVKSKALWIGTGVPPSPLLPPDGAGRLESFRLVLSMLLILRLLWRIQP